jgi:hypothetical protein
MWVVRLELLSPLSPLPWRFAACLCNDFSFFNTMRKNLLAPVSLLLVIHPLHRVAEWPFLK